MQSPDVIDLEGKYLGMSSQIIFKFVTDAPNSFTLQIYFEESF